MIVGVWHGRVLGVRVVGVNRGIGGRSCMGKVVGMLCSYGSGMCPVPVADAFRTSTRRRVGFGCVRQGGGVSGRREGVR